MHCNVFILCVCVFVFVPSWETQTGTIHNKTFNKKSPKLHSQNPGLLRLLYKWLYNPQLFKGADYFKKPWSHQKSQGIFHGNLGPRTRLRLGISVALITALYVAWWFGEFSSDICWPGGGPRDLILTQFLFKPGTPKVSFKKCLKAEILPPKTFGRNSPTKTRVNLGSRIILCDILLLHIYIYYTVKICKDYN